MDKSFKKALTDAADHLPDLDPESVVDINLSEWDHERVDKMSLEEARAIVTVQSQRLVMATGFNLTDDPADAMRVATNLAKEIMAKVLTSFYAKHVAAQKVAAADKAGMSESVDKEAAESRVTQAQVSGMFDALGIPAAAGEGPTR